MKGKILLAFTVITVFIIGVSDQRAMTNASGSAGGYTGSPHDGRTCGTNGGCHAGGSTHVAGMITSDIPASGYAPGEIYNITATVEQAGINKFGFELLEEDGAGDPKGTLMQTPATQLKLGGRTITHVSSSTAGTDSKAWTFQWQAPAAGSGEVNFYAAFNAADGQNNTTGDQIFNSDLTVAEGWPVAVSANPSSLELKIFPNPASDAVSVTLPQEFERATLSVLDLTGKPVFHQDAEGTKTQVDVSGLPAGVYFLMAQSSDQSAVKRIMVR